MLNFVDLVFAVVIVLAMARGWSRGFVSTIATYTAPVLGFMVAADMSDPMRDWLATVLDAPDIALDLLAPLAVFVVVVAIIRLVAAVIGRLLGVVGISLPGRVLGAALSGFVLAVLLGAGVLMVDEVSPHGDRAAREGGTQVPDKGADPLADLVMDIDRQLDESALAPRLAMLATTAWRKVSGTTGEGPLVPSEEIEAARRRAGEAVQREAADAVQREADAEQRDSAKAAPGPPADPPAR
jgi:uncharacterized membrane protein required for colicin V production